MRNNRQRRGNSSFSATVLLSLLLLLAVTCRRRGVEAFLNPLVSLDCSIGSNLSRTTTATILRQRQNPSRSVYSYNYNNNALGRCTRNSSSRRRHHSTSRTTTTTTPTNLHAVMDIVGVSPEPIHTAFAYATFGPQPFWLLLIVLPKANITKQVMGKLGKCVRACDVRCVTWCCVCCFHLQLLVVLILVLVVVVCTVDSLLLLCVYSFSYFLFFRQTWCYSLPCCTSSLWQHPLPSPTPPHPSWNSTTSLIRPKIPRPPL